MWKTFHFESSRIKGLIDTKDKWKNVVFLYDGDVDGLRKTRVSSDYKKDELPHFGFGWGYSGVFALGEWADENGIDLDI